MSAFQGMLIRAAKSGNVIDLMSAIRAGAELEAQDPECRNNTALHWSVYHGHKNIILKLLSLGVNVDARDEHGNSALHVCCSRGHKDVALILLGGGAIVDATNNEGFTPLMYASLGGHDNIVVCLLEDAGADAGLKNNHGGASIHAASVRGNTSVVSILAQYGDGVMIKDNSGKQPIHCATHGGYAQTVSTLIQSGADVNCTDGMGATPLCYSSEKGNVDVVEALLKNGADTNITSQGKQATHLAAMNGHLDVLVKLKEYRSDLNALAEPTQQTPLHFAVQYNHNKVAEWLILNGANPYTYDGEGNTPTHLALNKGHIKLVDFMASRNVHVISPGGHTPSTSEEASSLNCAICMEVRKTTIMTEPCHHASTCKDCMDAMEARGNHFCPICRATITKRITIYL